VITRDWYKKQVSVRLEIDTYIKLREAIRIGLIANQDQAVNKWLRDALDNLLAVRSPSDVPKPVSDEETSA